ncbi:MAG: class A beta-lactamase-related serine hydrolase [Acidobacteria bacterium]|nr:MAG: class A beta-lactamase-related serine hydrolase [Acidobacteriota bacterium]
MTTSSTAPAATTLALPRAAAEIERGIDAGLHLGGQLYVSRRGVGSAALAFGERAPGTAMTGDTLMIWLSSSKPVAAVAIAQLWERGRLALDDAIARHVPEFGQGGKENVTLRHALTHTGGFRLLATGWPEASWEEIIATICRARLEPRWVPGRKAGYHLTSSWFMLGEVVRRLDGRPFSRYVREEIFEPLAMDDCWIGMPAERFEAYGDRIGPMYDTSGEVPRPRSWHRRPEHVVGCSPGGNGHGPMRQLGRFYAMLLGGGELDGRRLLRPQTVEALTAVHRFGMMDLTFKHELPWGLGFIIRSPHEDDADQAVPYGYGRFASRRTYGHSGAQSSTAFADPEYGLVVALALNGQPGEARHNARMRRITEAIYEDLGLAAGGAG